MKAVKIRTITRIEAGICRVVIRLKPITIRNFFVLFQDSYKFDYFGFNSLEEVRIEFIDEGSNDVDN